MLFRDLESALDDLLKLSFAIILILDFKCLKTKLSQHNRNFWHLHIRLKPISQVQTHKVHN